MPELVRLYLRNIAIGAALGVLFTGALIGLNVGNLRHLVTAAHGGVLAIVLLAVFNTLVFAGVQFAIAVMRMAEDGRPPRSGLRAPTAGLQPVRVKQAAVRSLRK